MEARLNTRYIKIFLAVMLITAGLAHVFFREEFTAAIPEIIPLKSKVNFVVAIIEVVLGTLYFTSFKKTAYKATFILFTIYLWVHINFIQIGSCIPSLCIAPWIAWTRLILIHPILLYTVYYLIKNDRSSVNI